MINDKTGKKKYYKDNPEAVKKRDAKRMWVNGKEISKKHPLHKPGRYKTFNEAAFDTAYKIHSIKEGYVYAITNKAWPGWVKIGMAIDAEDRCNGYQTGSPYRDYILEHSVYTDDRRQAEQEAHGKAILKSGFDSGNEWFKISVEDAVSILNSLNVSKKPEKVSKEKQQPDLWSHANLKV